MNIVLCGMMGAGKTAVGKELAILLNRQWWDTDVVIEEKYGKISDIFARFGEARFREMETDTIRTLSKQGNAVLSVGGGLVLREENVVLLKENGCIVYLRAKQETLVARLRTDTTRPLLQGTENLETRVHRLLSERSAIYEKVSDFALDVDEKTPQEIAAEIMKKIEK